MSNSVDVTMRQTLAIGEHEDVYDRIVSALTDSERGRLKRGMYARRREVVDPFGISIGTAVAVMVDRETARPQWLAIQLTDTDRTLVVGAPITGLQLIGQRASVMFGASAVSTAPPLDPEYLPGNVERALCRHYFCEPTRGADLDDREQRATSSQAFWTSTEGGRIGWLPGPRSERWG